VPQSTRLPPPLWFPELADGNLFTSLTESRIQSQFFSYHQSSMKVPICFNGDLMVVQGLEFDRVGADIHTSNMWSRPRVAAAILSGFRQEFEREQLSRFDALVATLRQSPPSHHLDTLAAENAWTDTIFGGLNDMRKGRKIVEMDEEPNICLVPSEARFGDCTKLHNSNISHSSLNEHSDLFYSEL
jgi:hypothetical protein